MKKFAFTLAEFFSPHYAGYRKSAFTLAEVLITLAIIGVVAAMTMPTLIQKYQNIVTVNKLKKHYSMMSQNFKRMLLDEDVDSMYDTKLAKLYTNLALKELYGEDLQEHDIENYNTENNAILKKYLKIQEVDIPAYSVKTLCDVSNASLSIPIIEENSFKPQGALPDGSLISIQSFDFFDFDALGSEGAGMKMNYVNCKNQMANQQTLNCPTHMGGMFYYIDLNGRKGPNVLGRDIFDFTVDQFGQVGVDGFYLQSGEYGSLGNQLSSGHGSLSCGNLGKSLKEIPARGSGCVGRIMRNGWKIDY